MDAGSTPSNDLFAKPVKRKKGVNKIDKDEQDYLDYLLSLVVARTTVSVSFVTDENFRKFLKELNPEVISLFYVELLFISFVLQYSPPGRTKISDLIGKVSEKLVETMKTNLKSARRVAITMDCWAGKGSVDNFLGITAHFFDTSSGERKSLRLGKISSLYAK